MTCSISRLTASIRANATRLRLRQSLRRRWHRHLVVFLAISFTGACFICRRLPRLAHSLPRHHGAYSLALKRIVILDVVVLSALYTLRMLAGAAATDTHISPWLAAFAIFIFLSLAMVKRFSELQNVRSAGTQLSNGRGYLLNDIEQIRSFGTSSAFASVVVFSVYIGQPEDARPLHHHERMWLITPLMILWLCRVWLLASRGELDEDPVVFALPTHEPADGRRGCRHRPRLDLANAGPERIVATYAAMKQAAMSGTEQQSRDIEQRQAASSPRGTLLHKIAMESAASCEHRNL